MDTIKCAIDALARRFPFLGLVAAILVSNLAGSFFNFFYNTQLIVRYLDPAQEEAFHNVALPMYNLLAYPAAMGVFFYKMWPTIVCLGKLRRGEPVEPALLELGRRRLVNLPLLQLVVNPIAWLPGAIIFPLIVTTFGDAEQAGWIWRQFVLSFLVSTVFTTVQTFFVLQAYLTAYLYPVFFKDTRPETVPGIWRIPFTIRLVMLWGAVALMPLVALLVVALNFPERTLLILFASSLVVVSALSGGGIFYLIGRDLWQWMQQQTAATAEVAAGNFDVRIEQPRPDEWGRLTNRFNDMAASLAEAWESHETLGQLVSPAVRDRILRRMHGFEVEEQEITVLFVDIRGFTPRCAGADPARIGALLNRFLTLALQSIEEKGGYVNKFLGDGVMALFGATHKQADHADLALASARELLRRLDELNTELALQGEAPLAVGIGIHTGIALVGCFGATVRGDAGQTLMRREFTAIGETVNLCQRIEQLTKKCGGPILFSAGTKTRLAKGGAFDCVGPQDLPGASEPMIVYRASGQV